MVLQPYLALFFPTFLKTLTQALLTPGQVLFSYSQKGRFVPMCHHTVNNSRPPALQLNASVLNCSDSVKLTFLPHHTQHLLCTPNKAAHYHKNHQAHLGKTHPSPQHSPLYRLCQEDTPRGPCGSGSLPHSETDMGISNQIPKWEKKRKKKNQEAHFFCDYQLSLEISSGNWQRANNFDLAPCQLKTHHCEKALQLGSWSLGSQTFLFVDTPSWVQKGSPSLVSFWTEPVCKLCKPESSSQPQDSRERDAKSQSCSPQNHEHFLLSLP